MRWLTVADFEGLTLAVPWRPICGGGGGGDSTGGMGDGTDLGQGTGPGVSGAGLTGGSISGEFDPVSGGYTDTMSDPEGSGQASSYFPTAAPAAAPSSGGGGGGDGGGGGEGGGGGGDFSLPPNPFLTELLDWSKTRRGYVQPFEKELFTQGTEALKTGGVGAQIPIIQQAVEASKQATGNSLKQTQDQLEGVGLGNTVFGARTQAAVRTAGEQQAARIGPDLAQQLVNLVSGVLPQATAQITSGLASGASTQMSGDVASMNARTQAMISEQVAAIQAQTARDVAQINAQAQIDSARIGADAAAADAKRRSNASMASAIGSIIGTIGIAAFAAFSDRNAKEAFEPVDPQETLAKVVALPIERWSYKGDTGVRHLGPMAQDFAAAFQVGVDAQHIFLLDASGVALSAIQALHARIEELERKLAVAGVA